MLEVVASILWVGATIVGLWLVVEFLATFWPLPWRTLQDAELKRNFHGLILFGKNGSFVSIAEKMSGNQIRFVKSAASDKPWQLKAIWAPKPDAESVVSQLTPKLGMLGEKLKISRDAENTISVAGPGLSDPVLLENFARLLMQDFWPDSDAKFRVEFCGPKDNDAINDYFGLKSKK